MRKPHLFRYKGEWHVRWGSHCPDWQVDAAKAHMRRLNILRAARIAWRGVIRYAHDPVHDVQAEGMLP